MTRIKSIPNFPSYAVAEDGRIFSTSKFGAKGGEIIPRIRKHTGYSEIGLYKDGKRCFRLLHRLVLETFVGPCPAGMEARHNNGNKTDNCLENLRWDTCTNNTFDAIKHGTHRSLKQNGEQNCSSKLSDKDVRLIIYMYRTRLFTQQEIANLYNVTQGEINMIVSKKIRKNIWS